jgi:hypothetical protein
VVNVPKKQAYYEPDAIDCNTMSNAIAQDFGCLCDITTRFELDQVIVLVRAYQVVSAEAKEVKVQALSRMPLRHARNLYTQTYGALLDCWHQLDRGVLGAETRPVERGWDGRPRQPVRRT